MRLHGCWVALPPLLWALRALAEEEVEDNRGCTDTAATNFKPLAAVDDGSCGYTCEALQRAEQMDGAACHIYRDGAYEPDLKPPNASVPGYRSDTVIVDAGNSLIVQGLPLSGANGSNPCAQPNDCAQLPFRFQLTEGASLTVRYVIFHRVVEPSPTEGGGVYTNGGKVTMFAVAADPTLEAMEGGVIKALNSVVRVTLALFDGNFGVTGGAVWAKESNLTLIRVTFRKSRGASHPGSGLWAENCSQVNITGSVFDHCTTAESESKPGSALYLAGSDPRYEVHPTDHRYLIVDTSFTPFDAKTTVVCNTSWLSSMGGCAEHPCEAGYGCSYREYSIWCDKCDPKLVGKDGLKCDTCPAGHGPNKAGDGCVPCTGNQYSPSGVCTSCESPLTVNKDHNACISFRCPSGQECINITSCSENLDCRKCPANYTSTNGIPCQICPAPLVANKERDSCAPCGPGKGPNEDRTSCINCTGNTVSTLGQCQPCAQGKVHDVDHIYCSMPRECPEGKYCKGGGACSMNECTKCEPGKVRAKGEPECTQCSNKQAANPKQTACTTCKGGQTPDQQHARCTNCTGPTYTSNDETSGTGEACATCREPYILAGCKGPAENPLVGCAGCHPCEYGKGPDSTRSRCVKCQGNTYSTPKDTGGMCLDCTVGRISSVDKTRCNKCGNRMDYPKGVTNSTNITQCTCASYNLQSPNGYYDVTQFGLIVCFRDGYSAPDVQTAVYTWDVDEEESRRCQKCPYCADCSGPIPKLRPGYVSDSGFHEARATETVPRSELEQRGNGYLYGFLCDSDTSVTHSDETKYGYLVSQLAISRCPGGLLRPSESSDEAAHGHARQRTKVAAEKCNEGHTGHFCMSCMTNFHTDENRDCQRCPATEGASIAIRISAVFATALLVLVGAKCWMRKNRRDSTGADHEDLGVPLMDPAVDTAVTLDDVAGQFHVPPPRRAKPALQLEPTAAFVNESESVRSARCGLAQCCGVQWGVLWAAMKMPFKTVVTYAQVVGQLGRVLHVPYPSVSKGVMNIFREAISFWDIFFNADCVGFSGYTAKWLLRVVGLPFVLLVCVVLLRGYDRCTKVSPQQAASNIKHRMFVALFFCYPTVCNVAFSAFRCKIVAPLGCISPTTGEQLGDGPCSVLMDDDTLICEDATMHIMKLLSGAVIVAFACGLPIIFMVVLIRKARVYEVPGGDFTVRPDQRDRALSSLSGISAEAYFSARELEAATEAAQYAIRDVTELDNYAFLIEGYCPELLWWETMDMLRKLALVGLVVLAGRGSVSQLAAAIVLAFFFFALHVKAWPMKNECDNLFRAAAEVHVFFTITCAFIFKSDLSHEAVNEDVYDWILFITFILAMPVGFVLCVACKLLRAQKEGLLEFVEAGKQPHRVAFARYEQGMASASDRNTLRRFFDTIEPQTAEQQRRSLRASFSTEVTTHE